MLTGGWVSEKTTSFQPKAQMVAPKIAHHVLIRSTSTKLTLIFDCDFDTTNLTIWRRIEPENGSLEEGFPLGTFWTGVVTIFQVKLP